MGGTVVFLLFLFANWIYGSPLTTISPLDQTSKAPVLNDDVKLENRSISDMVIKQTETVKKIVADQQLEKQDQHDYPVITKIDLDDKIKMDLDRLSLDELKIRCQHLSKLLNNSRLNQETKPHAVQYQPAFRPVIYEQNKKRPVYLQTPNVHYVNKFATAKPGFYVTTQGVTTPKPTMVTTTTPVSTNVKYIRLEPVILQKTILTDGRTVYYWHKSLPSAVAYQATSPKPTTESTTEYDVNETTEQTTSPYYNRWNFFTFYRHSTTTTTTERPTTSSTTTTTTQKPIETMFENQLRFVVPVPYQGPEAVPAKNVLGFDQYAYYPKDLQPSTINVQVPYTPTFHVIKALAVPNKYTNQQNYPEENLENVAV